MNNVILTGRLTRDPEMKTFDDGTSLCSFTLAVDKGKDATVFVACQSYDQKADLMGKTLRKGSFINVQGRLDQRVFETQSGEKKQVTFVRVDTFDYLEKKSTDAETSDKKTKEDLEKQKSFTADDVSALDLPDDDLPF